MDPDEAMASWQSLVESPAENMENRQLNDLARTIARSSPEKLNEMIDELNDPDLTGEKLIAIVASLEEVVSPALVPELSKLTEDANPGQVRGAATYLISLVRTPDAEAVLESLRNDSFGTVRLSALLGLSDRGDEAARTDLRTIYEKEGTTPVTRERILLSITQAPVDADRAVYESAIQTPGFEQQTYLMAVSALGRVGTRDSIDALNALKANPSCSVGVRDMCDNTIAAIEERLGAEPANAS
jgi:HEAT repeat protein